MSFRHGSGKTRAVPVSVPVLRWAVLLTLVLYTFGLVGIAATGARGDELPYAPPSFYVEPEPEGKPCPAAPTPLAEPPPPSEGEEPAPEVDPVLVELRALRIEAVETCEAQTASARELQKRFWWAVAEIEPLSGISETTNERLVSLIDGQCGNPCSTYAEGGHVAVTGTEGDPVQVVGDFTGGGGIGEPEMTELVSSIDAGAEASQGGLYMIAGLIVAFFIGAALTRTVDRGT